MDEGIKQNFFSDLRRLFPHNPEVDGLIQAFENVGLKSNQIDTSDGDDSIDHRNMQHPIRLDAEDCSFFIRTGTCKFGSTCKFNHPVSIKEEVDRGKSKRSVVGSSSKNLSRIPCKLIGMGFDKSAVIDVFFACEKNEEMTANYLLDHMHDFQ